MAATRHSCREWSKDGNDVMMTLPLDKLLVESINTILLASPAGILRISNWFAVQFLSHQSLSLSKNVLNIPNTLYFTIQLQSCSWANSTPGNKSEGAQ